MPYACDICGKKPSTGHTVSHANNKSKRRWLPNLQSVRAMQAGRPQRIRVCTTCIHSGRVTKVPYDLSGAKARAKKAAAA